MIRTLHGTQGHIILKEEYLECYLLLLSLVLMAAKANVARILVSTAASETSLELVFLIP